MKANSSRNKKIMTGLLRTSPNKQPSSELVAWDIPKAEYLKFLAAEYERTYRDYQKEKSTELIEVLKKIRKEYEIVSQEKPLKYFKQEIIESLNDRVNFIEEFSKINPEFSEITQSILKNLHEGINDTRSNY